LPCDKSISDNGKAVVVFHTHTEGKGHGDGGGQGPKKAVPALIGGSFMCFCSPSCAGYNLHCTGNMSTALNSPGPKAIRAAKDFREDHFANDHGYFVPRYLHEVASSGFIPATATFGDDQRWDRPLFYGSDDHDSTSWKRHL
jgi:hypothetical protein